MPQDTGIEDLLNSVRKTLQDLGNSVNNLASAYPDIFENPDLSVGLESFRSAHTEAAERLKTPRLSIAMIGTTSSGKSTIVNALIGRKLAPIEAGEMSGGVLTLRHAEASHLIVEATKDAAWETGEWADLPDEEIYARIRDGVMNPYHQARRKKSKSIIAAPQVTVSGPLLPAVDSDLLGLPLGLGIELIDLPGIKSVQDSTNLSVIQERVQKAFSLVALDYMQIDDDHRKLLLEELKKVVGFLRGRTDSMLFILNRVDQRGADDLPLSERLDSLQHEIKRELRLEELPDILPFSARLLYYAQCAYGPGGAFQVPPEKRLSLLSAMFRDCASDIKDKVSGNKDLKRWIRDLEDRTDDGECISELELEKLLGYVYEWSGGQEIWQRLSKRLKESFSELILFPALLHLFKSYDALSNSIDTVAAVRQIRHKKQVRAEQKKITETRKRLTEEIGQLQKRFHDDVSETIKSLKENTPESRSRITQKAQEQGLSGFQSLLTAVNDIEGDLATQIIRPVRDALLKDQPRHEVEESVAESVPPNLAEDLARAYDVASRRLRKFKKDGHYLSRRALKDDADAIKDLDNDEKSVRKLFLLMRRTLTTRAEFKIQTKAHELESALAELIQEVERQLIALCSNYFSNSMIEEAIVASYTSLSSTVLPSLPPNFFHLTPNIQREQIQESQVVGREKVTEAYTTGTCYKSEQKREVYRDKKGLREYRTVILPSIDAMAEDWQSGVEKGKDELWDILCKWMTQRLDLASSQFNQSVEKIITLAEGALEEQLEILNADYASEMQRWNSIRELKQHSRSLHLLLKKASGSC